jgi:putative transposase
LAESFNGLYKTELIHPRGPWQGLDDVEFATMTYIDWFNHRRLDSQIATGPSYVTPAEHEANYYHQTQTAEQAVTH